MTAPDTTTPLIERHLTADDLHAALARDVRAGLTSSPKTLPPKYFYDARGSELFEQITRLPEYYLTRAERAILSVYADQIAKLAEADTLVELGSGSSEKTRLLPDAMRAEGGVDRYVPVDVSHSALIGAVETLNVDYPTMHIHGLVADLDHQLHLLPSDGNRLFAYLGSTIGNHTPVHRARFLETLRATLGPEDALLLGVDLVKDTARLVAAYDDVTGITASFNRNVLHVINHQLDADFDTEAFEHVALWDADYEWIEMRLASRRPCAVHAKTLDLTISFAEGEQLRTEISTKFRRHRIEAELVASGYAPVGWWTDPDSDFALALARAQPS